MGYVLDVALRPIPTPPPSRWAVAPLGMSPGAGGPAFLGTGRPVSKVSQAQNVSPRFWRLLGLDKPIQIVTK